MYISYRRRARLSLSDATPRETPTLVSCQALPALNLSNRHEDSSGQLKCAQRIIRAALAVNEKGRD